MPKTDGLTDKQRRFYVYVVTANGRACYVGKGTALRYRIHLTNSHNPEIRAHVAAGKKIRSRIIVSNLTEAEAFKIERMWIEKFRGRLANADKGVRPWQERVLWELREYEAQRKPEWVIWKEGARHGLSAQERIRAYERQSNRIFSLKMEMERQLGVCHG